MRRPINQRLEPALILRQIRGFGPAEIGLVLVAAFCSLQVAIVFAISLLHLAHLL